MSDAPETPAPSPGLIARLAAAISNSAPVIEPSAEVDAVTAQLAALQADHQALTEAATLAAEKLEAVQAELVTAQTEQAALQAKVAAVDAAVPGLSASAEPKAFFTAAVTTAAQEQIAASGFKPDAAPAVDANAGNEPEAMAHADFNKLSVTARNEFMSNGGKLK